MILDKILSFNQIQISNFKENSFLPIYLLYTNGGMASHYLNEDEHLLYNVNNLFWLNPFLPYFNVTNFDIDIVAGIYYDVDSIEYYKMIKSFAYDKLSLWEYKDINKKISGILDKHNVKIDDLIYAMHIRDMDKEENLYRVNFKMSKEYKDFFEDNDSYQINYQPKNIMNYFMYKDITNNNVYFTVKSIKLINLKANVRFIVYVSDSIDYVKELYKNHVDNLLKEGIKENENKSESEFAKNLLSNCKEQLYFKNENECIQTNEINLNHFQNEKLKPLVIVDIKKSSDYEDIIINQNFIARFVLIKQIKYKQNENEKIKFVSFPELPELPEVENESQSEIGDKIYYDTWDLQETLPKIFFFGSLFNSD